MQYIIKNGKVVSEFGVMNTDILIEGETILSMEENIEIADSNHVKVIDAEGCYVLPGAVDIHTHMDLDVGIARVIDDFYEGTVAAACGGTTTIVDHIAFGPKDCSLWHQVREYHHLAEDKAVIDYGFHGVFQHVNDEVLSEMREIACKEGITSFKIYMTYDYKLDDKDILRVLKQAEKDGIVIMVHCENDGIVSELRSDYVKSGNTSAKYHPLSRPNDAEAEAVNRMLYLAHVCGNAPLYIVHLSTKEGLAAIRAARKRGQKRVAAETCPQYLLLDDSIYEDPQEGLKAIMAPPLRKKGDQEALWCGLAKGDIDTVATDHCPFTFASQKQQGADNFTQCPSGAPGVEERLPLLYSEGVAKRRISIEQLVHYLCTNPAKIAGIYPKKGILQPGSDADLVILDPEKCWTLTKENMHGASDYTCYEGWKMKGDIRLVMQRGNILVKDHEFLGRKGAGQYLHRSQSSLIKKY